MTESLDLPELPFKIPPIYSEEVSDYLPVLQKNGEIAGVFRFLADSYNCLDNWELALTQKQLLSELPDFGISKVWHAAFVTKDFHGRNRVAAIVEYLPEITLDEVFNDDPEKAKPQINKVVEHMLNYFEYKFKTGDRYLIDISRFDQYMFTADGPVLIDLEGFCSYTIEDIRNEEDEDSVELAEAEKMHALQGNAGVARLGIRSELRFLPQFYADKVSPEIYSRCCTMKEMADQYVEDILRRKG